MAVYTVGLPRAMRNYEYWAYIRPLVKGGVDIAHAPRVIDPVGGERWLYAWTDEAAVTAYVEALRANEENDRWRVIPVPDAVPDVGPLGPVDVILSRRAEGCFYTIDGSSQDLIVKSFPRAAFATKVFIGTYDQADFDQTQRRFWDQVVAILTGLSGEQLAQLGGYRLIDSKTKETLRKAPLHPPADLRPVAADLGRRPGQESIPQPLEAERALGLHVLGAEDKPQL